MRKLFLTLLLIFGLSMNSYGATISYDALVTDDDLTITWLNTTVGDIVDAVNSPDGALIKAGTISSDSLSDNANPVLRWDDAFNDFVITGLLPPTSASLTTTTTAGRALIGGYYVQKDATSHTYTASKDTYVDLSKTGVYTYSAVANDAVEPATTSNSIRVAKVVTDATAVTSVEDKRTTSINIANKDDHMVVGLNLIAVSPDCWSAALITVDSGVCYVGTTRVEKTDKTTLHLGTASSWHDGAADAGADAWWYVGVDTAGSVKLLGANVPDKSDTDGSTGGVKRYWYDSGNTKYWRVVGVFRAKSTPTVSYDFYQIDDTIYYRHNLPFNCGSSNTWAEADISHLVPPVSEEVLVYAAAGSGGATKGMMRSNIQSRGSAISSANFLGYLSIILCSLSWFLYLRHLRG